MKSAVLFSFFFVFIRQNVATRTKFPLENIFNESERERIFRPNYPDTPVTVTVSFRIIDYTLKDEIMHVILNHEYSWHDQRLAYETNSPIYNVTINTAELVPKIWIPAFFWHPLVAPKVKLNSFATVLSNGTIRITDVLQQQFRCWNTSSTPIWSSSFRCSFELEHLHDSKDHVRLLVAKELPVEILNDANGQIQFRFTEASVAVREIDMLTGTFQNIAVGLTFARL